jgi:hypothetical protein
MIPDHWLSTQPGALTERKRARLRLVLPVERPQRLHYGQPAAHPDKQIKLKPRTQTYDVLESEFFSPGPEENLKAEPVKHAREHELPPRARSGRGEEVHSSSQQPEGK